MQTVGQLHQQHANVVRHCEHQLTEVLRLFRALREQLQFREFRHPGYQRCNLGPKIGFDVLKCGAGIFHGVVEQRGRDGRGIKLQISKNPSDFQRV